MRKCLSVINVTKGIHAMKDDLTKGKRGVFWEGRG